jgi:hypothetical protein
MEQRVTRMSFVLAREVCKEQTCGVFARGGDDREKSPAIAKLDGKECGDQIGALAFDRIRAIERGGA